MTIKAQSTMLATSKNVLFPGHMYNHLQTTGTDDPPLSLHDDIKGDILK